jgi:peptidoglycan/LPS O-acetylase OafA/YrhL
MGIFAVHSSVGWFPIALFLLVPAFANLDPDEQSWWRKPATLLGESSYSIYLIHSMVLLAASAVVSKFPNLPIWSQEPIRIVCFPAVAAISVLSWRYFETPAIRLGNRIAARKPQISPAY